MTLFLDVDGVLNILSPSYTTTGYSIEPHLVRRLEYIIGKCCITNIVITSAWSESIIPELQRHNFKYIDHITDFIHNSLINRGQIILDYTIQNKVKNYIILEDEPALFEKYLDIEQHLIKVDFRNGISSSNVSDCILKTAKQISLEL